jgi:hypothetical protein
MGIAGLFGPGAGQGGPPIILLFNLKDYNK